MTPLKIVFSIFLILVGALFYFFIGVLDFVEVLPDLKEGTLSVESNCVILNRVSVGNEIYALIAIYAAVAASLAAGGFVLLQKR